MKRKTKDDQKRIILIDAQIVLILIFDYCRHQYCDTEKARVREKGE